MTDHSPTPWYVIDEHLPGIESADDRSIVVYGADEPGDEAGVHGETPDQARANAAFIVKAVNNHDALSKVLERLLKTIDSGSWRDGTHLSIAAHPAVDDARELLAAVSTPSGDE